MQVSSLGDIIATRKFSSSQDPQLEVVARMGRPQPSPEREEEWFCPIQIVGIGDEKIRAIYGIDAFQALQLALQFIGGSIFVLNREHGGSLRWNDSEGLGFEVPEWANAPRGT